MIRLAGVSWYLLAPNFHAVFRSFAVYRLASIAFVTQTHPLGIPQSPYAATCGKKGETITNTKDTFLSVRLKPEDNRKLRTLTEESGLSASRVIRKLIHGVEIKPRRPEGLKELALAINREGVNINQIARNANAGILTENDVTELMLRQAKIEELLSKAVNQ